MPFISVCIPAYRNPHYLSRLLESISIQTFKDFEVIVTDDSPDDLLQPIIDQYNQKLGILYIKNKIAFGTPANWNFAISKARGAWIKLMHNDDWFANENSLGVFASAALNSNGKNFIFSGFNEVQDDSIKKHIINKAEKLLLKKSPFNLFKRNFIGPPSTTLINNNQQEWYDENVKWVVDFEFYIRCLRQTNFLSIDLPLINIGIHNNQVTKEAFGNPAIEIPENLYLLNKIGADSLKNLFVYDYYWRLFRNLKIRDFSEVTSFYSSGKLPDQLKKMLSIQFKIPLSILDFRVFSKSGMLVSKLFSR